MIEHGVGLALVITSMWGSQAIGWRHGAISWGWVKRGMMRGLKSWETVWCWSQGVAVDIRDGWSVLEGAEVWE